MTVARTRVVIDWLTSLGWDTRQELGYPLAPGDDLPQGPDKIVFVTMTGGPGYQTDEGSVDGWTFQARVRGPANDPLAPEAAAIDLDRLILTASYPAQADGVTISNAHRLGSPPVPLPVDPSDLRYEYTANYVIKVGV